MRVLVLGGTGTLGRQIAKQALDAGHTVRCMVRSPRKASFLQEWGCELTRGNLLDPDSLAYALEDQEAVIDAATARPTDSQSVYRIDWDGKLNLYTQCRAKGVRRVVFTSLLEAERFRSVPLMDIKHCTEQMLLEGDFDVTILRTCAFMQRPVCDPCSGITDRLGERQQHADRLHEHPRRGPLCGGCLGPRANHWRQLSGGGAQGLEHR